MKKYLLLFAVMLMGLCACEKENGSDTSGNLEGSWDAYKGELLFDGKTIERIDASMPHSGIETRLTFSDGHVTIEDEDGTEYYPYTYANKTITLTAYFIPIQMKVKKLTSSELHLEIPTVSYDPELDGEVVAQFNGRTIYGSSNFFMDRYWYMVGSKVVPCIPVDDEDYSEGWYDTVLLYLKRSK